MATSAPPPPAAPPAPGVKSESRHVVHDKLRPLEWMIGRWRGCGEGKFPEIDDFDYTEDISFTSVGQPALNYQALSRTPDGSRPMHLESGFLRVNPMNTAALECAFLVAHNFGLTTLEEGLWDPAKQELVLELKNLTRMSFAKEPSVKETRRIYRRVSEDEMEFILYMGTSAKPLQEHLRITYRKVC